MCRIIKFYSGTIHCILPNTNTDYIKSSFKLLYKKAGKSSLLYTQIGTTRGYFDYITLYNEVKYKFKIYT